MKVAALEHLLVLKLEAYADRRHSSKGQKDAKDIVRIAVALETRSNSGDPIDPGQIIPYLRDLHLPLLLEVEKSSAALSICKGNAHLAKSLRGTVGTLIKTIADASDGEGGSRHRSIRKPGPSSPPPGGLSGPR